MSASASLTDIESEVISKLQFINKQFFTTNGLSSGFTGLNPYIAESSIGAFTFNGICSYSQFISANSPFTADLSAITTNMANFKTYMSNGSNYTTIASPYTGLIDNNSIPTCSNIVFDTTSGNFIPKALVGGGTGTGTLALYLNAFRLAGNLASKYPIFQGSAQATLNKYDISSTLTTSTVTINYTGGNLSYTNDLSSTPAAVYNQIFSGSSPVFNIANMYNNTVAQQQNNLFVFQRLMIMYELVLSTFISLYIVSNSTGTQQTNAVALVNYFYNQLLQININVLSSNTGVTSIHTNTNIYNNNLAKIKKADSSISTGKTNLTDYTSVYSSQKSIVSTAQRLEYATIAIFTIVVIGEVAVLSVISAYSDEATVRTYALGMFATTVVAAVVLLIIKGRVYEPFTTSSPSLQVSSSYTQVLSTSGGTGFIADYATVLFAEVSNYLDQTTQLGLLTVVNRTYSDLNYTMGKELSYYNDASIQLTNTTNNVLTAGRIVNLQSQIVYARITFLITLAIIISTSVLLYIYVGDRYKLTILIIAVIVSLFALFIYVYDTVRLVRSDGTKLYFGKPSQAK